MPILEQDKLELIKNGNYKYYGFKVVSATIDTTSLERCGQGIKWNPATINKGKVCNYTVTLQDKQGATFTIEDSLVIKDIIETKQKNPSLLLQDNHTNVVAGLDLEIQTSSFLNEQTTVMSKVLGCTIYNKKDREKYIHCAIPTIQNYEPIYPALYMILSDKSVYVGITYRNLYERIYEHCTLTKNKKEKATKSTYDMLAYENTEVYCIGKFTNYTLEEIETMDDKDRDSYFHKMEQLETAMISIASREFSHLELVNKKQIITDDKELKAKVLALPTDLTFEIDWDCWDSTHEPKFEPCSDGMADLVEDVYKLAHKVEISDSLISLYETVGVTPYDLAKIVSNITKPKKHSEMSRLDYSYPTVMPQGSDKDRFDSYLEYMYNPELNKSKPYCKSTIYGWSYLSVKEMEDKVQEWVDHNNKKRKLYQAYIDSETGMFVVHPMVRGKVKEKEVVFQHYIEECQDKGIIQYGR